MNRRIFVLMLLLVTASFLLSNMQAESKGTFQATAAYALQTGDPWGIFCLGFTLLVSAYLLYVILIAFFQRPVVAAIGTAAYVIGITLYFALY